MRQLIVKFSVTIVMERPASPGIFLPRRLRGGGRWCGPAAFGQPILRAALWRISRHDRLEGVYDPPARVYHARATT
jgi:hypothetical protein